MRTLTFMLALATPLAASAANSDSSNSMPTEHVVVTASRLDLTPDSVLDRADIDRLNPQSTTQLLRSLPNVIISENGGSGGQSFVSIRGGEPNFTLVLVDGITVNDPTNSRGGGFDFNLIDPATIERVEVYRGGISAIYGGEAINGVIHFITRASANEVAVAWGNEGQKRVSATIATDLSDSLTGMATFSNNEVRRSHLSSYRNRQALGKLLHKDHRSNSTLLLSLADQTTRALPEDGGGLRAPQPMAEKRDSRQMLVGLNSEQSLTERISGTVNASYSRYEDDSSHPGIAEGVLSGIPPSEIQADYRQYLVEGYLTVRDVRGWNFLAGSSYRTSKGRNKGHLDFGMPIPAGFSLKQDTWSLFAEASTAWKALNIDAGLRHDIPDGFGEETSLRLSLSHPVGPATLHASYSEGYKLPSFFGLAHPLTGNSDLKPEKSASSTLGASLTTHAGASASLTYFYNEFTDLVDFDAEAFMTVNRSEVVSEGVEFNADAPLTSWLVLGMDVTYLSTDIRNTDDRLRRRPRWSGGINAQAIFEKTEVRLSVDTRGSFHDSSVLTGPLTMDGYTSVNLSINHRILPKLILTLQASNLFDSRIEEAVGFTDTGRLWQIGFRYGS